MRTWSRKMTKRVATRESCTSGASYSSTVPPLAPLRTGATDSACNQWSWAQGFMSLMTDKHESRWSATQHGSPRRVPSPSSHQGKQRHHCGEENASRAMRCHVSLKRTFTESHHEHPFKGDRHVDEEPVGHTPHQRPMLRQGNAR